MTSKQTGYRTELVTHLTDTKEQVTKQTGYRTELVTHLTDTKEQVTKQTGSRTELVTHLTDTEEQVTSKQTGYRTHVGQDPVRRGTLSFQLIFVPGLTLTFKSVLSCFYCVQGSRMHNIADF